MDFELLQELIQAFTLHQQEKGVGAKTSLNQFAIWVNEQQYGKGEPETANLNDILGRNDIDTEIGKLIVYLNRYAKLLIKKGLVDFPELVNEDFTYLYILMTAESMTKMQLIEKNVHEKPTGLEVIKRLLKHGLIGERNDEFDKRSKRVFLTDKGKATFFGTLENMGKISKLIAGNLTEKEKLHLYALLRKLEDFHSPIFLQQKSSSLDQLNGNLK